MVERPKIHISYPYHASYSFPYDCWNEIKAMPGLMIIIRQALRIVSQIADNTEEMNT